MLKYFLVGSQSSGAWNPSLAGSGLYSLYFIFVFRLFCLLFFCVALVKCIWRILQTWQHGTSCRRWQHKCHHQKWTFRCCYGCCCCFLAFHMGRFPFWCSIFHYRRNDNSRRSVRPHREGEQHVRHRDDSSHSTVAVDRLWRLQMHLEEQHWRHWRHHTTIR